MGATGSLGDHRVVEVKENVWFEVEGHACSLSVVLVLEVHTSATGGVSGICGFC